MKLLLWDIETSPHLANVWGLHDQHIGLSQLRQSGSVLCVGYKWYGDKSTKSLSVYREGRQVMLQKTWDLLNEADALVSWNGKSFDTKTINKEFFLEGMTPPSPAREVDLMLAARKRFRLASNKLEYVSRAIGLPGKKSHEGFDLWLKVMDPEHPEHDSAWRRMLSYCRQDVTLLQDLYDRLLPWLPNLPNAALYVDAESSVCPGCASTNLQRRGTARLVSGEYQRYQCQECGRWSRGTKRLGSVDIVSIAT